jgi:putative radical SAM enzyme (TIGR03279 family)
LAVIQEVTSGSAAERAGIKAGMTLLTVNNVPLGDIIDWKKALARPRLDITLQDIDGTTVSKTVRHASGEDIGVVFTSPTVDCLKQCGNNCIFCFVKQMPPGQRKTLYVRDDDYRLSLVFGSFVTLTNVSEPDWQRILREKISPIYVSVHTTNPQLRSRIMGNVRARAIMTQLRELVQAGITVHTQLVLVPGVNDGAELERSLDELWSLYPGVESVAVVPVGLTGYRENLPLLSGFTSTTARDVLDATLQRSAKYRRRSGTSFVYLADEFFVLARADYPAAAYYDDFSQLENGVGISRLLIDEFLAELKHHRRRRQQSPPPVLWVTGESAAGTMITLQHRINLLSGSRVDVLPVKNRHFGGQVTVTGLLTGECIHRALTEEHPVSETVVLIPDIILRDGLFLDGMTFAELEGALPQLRLVVCPTLGAELVRHTLIAGGER